MSGDSYESIVGGVAVKKSSIDAGPASAGNAGSLVALGTDGKIAGALLNAAGSGIEVLSAAVTLNRANILALNATPFTLVAAPGAGKVLVPLAFMLKYTFGVAAFADGGSLTAIYESDGVLEAGAAGVTNAMLLAAANRLAFIGSSSDFNGVQAGAALSNAENNAIVLKTNVAYTDAGGTSTGTLTVTTWYISADV